MLFPRKDEVLEIHRRLPEQFGGRPGTRDEGLLDSALLAAANREHYEGAGLATCAATCADHLTRDHPFVDGDKRVGAAVAEIFVRLNRGELTATPPGLAAGQSPLRWPSRPERNRKYRSVSTLVSVAAT